MEKRHLIISILLLFHSYCCTLQKNPTLLKDRGLLPLPEQFHNKPVYYLQTPCIQGISCGYYTLYNAVQLEKAQLNLPEISLDKFYSVCNKPSRIGPQKLSDGTTHQQRKEVANNFGLSPMIMLDATPERSGKFSIDMHVDYLREESKKEVPLKSFRDLREGFLNGRYDTLHFIATLKVAEVPHAILISAIRHSDGSMALYLFDNCHVNVENFPILAAYLNVLLSIITPYDIKKMLDGALLWGNSKLLRYLLTTEEALKMIKEPREGYLIKASTSLYSNLEIFDLLINNGVALSNIKNPIYELLQYKLCSSAETQAIIKRLLEAGVDPFIKNEHGESAATYIIRKSEFDPACLAFFESHLQENQRKEFQELKKTVKTGFSIRELLKRRKISDEPPHSGKLDLTFEKIDSLDGLELIKRKSTIHEINLEANQISHIGKNDFKEFRYVYTLNLGYNHMESIDPQSFEDLKSLKHLLLYHNDLSNFDPKIVAHLSELELLDLTHNKIPPENIQQIKAVLPAKTQFKHDK